MRFREFVEYEDELDLYIEAMGANWAASLAQKFPQLYQKYGQAFMKTAAALAMAGMGDNLDQVTEDAMMQGISHFMQGGPAWLKSWVGKIKGMFSAPQQYKNFSTSVGQMIPLAQPA